MKYSLFFLFILLYQVNHSQENNIINKNEIGVNIAPLIVLGTANDYQNFTIEGYYKRSIGSWKIRGKIAKISVRHTPYHIVVLDSTISINPIQQDQYQVSYQTNNIFRTKLGLEYRWKFKQMGFSAGLDTFHKYLNTLIYLNTKHQELTETYPDFFTWRTNLSKVESVDNKYSMVGLYPFVGFHAALSKRLAFNMEFGIHMSKGNEEINIKSDFPIEIKNVIHHTEVNTAIINDISISYSF